jgi:ABC-type lipoprotein export system ATPase subunit
LLDEKKLQKQKNLMSVLELSAINKAYGVSSAGGARHVVLQDINLVVESGTFVALMGPSGSGKTTLLNLAGGLDKPDSGQISVAGADIGKLSDSEASAWRLKNIGFVFQFFNLLPNLSARDNVELPLRLMGNGANDIRTMVETAVERVGLLDKIDRMPYELSGGEMQRMAIARAIAHRPTLLLADEPTGNLDSATGESVLEFLKELVDDDGMTILMATHDARGRTHCDRVIDIQDGRITGESENSDSAGGAPEAATASEKTEASTEPVTA